MTKFLMLISTALIIISLQAQFGQTQTVTRLKVKCDIHSRFSSTIIQSTIVNQDVISKDISFPFWIPEWAYISNFSIHVDNVTIVASLQDHETASQIYLIHKERQKSAGLVAKIGSSEYQIFVNVPSGSTVNFTVTYQGLLTRDAGLYKQVIHLKSNNINNDTKILLEISIIEKNLLRNISIPKIGTPVRFAPNDRLIDVPQESSVQHVAIYSATNSQSYTRYIPAVGKFKNGAIDEDIAVLYGLESSNAGGTIHVLDGYFVHFFSPPALPPTNKDIVYVFDTRCSGYRLHQIQKAVLQMFADMHEEDNFNVIAYGDETNQWKGRLMKRSRDKAADATRFVISTVRDYSTNQSENFGNGLTTAFEQLNRKDSTNRLPMIIWLIDSKTLTDSNTAIEKYEQLINQLNADKNISLHILQLGNQGDSYHLRRISDSNRGLTVRIYDDFDAGIQISSFLSKVSSPAVTRYKFEYLNETVDTSSLVDDHKFQYFHGDEIVTVGRLKRDAHTASLATFVSRVKGQTDNDTNWLEARAHNLQCPELPIITDDENVEPCCLTFPHCSALVSANVPHPSWSVAGFIERMWAYKMIKKLLIDAKDEPDPNVKRAILDRARLLGLKYHFVTELTSLVAVQSSGAGPGFSSGTQFSSTFRTKPELEWTTIEFGPRTLAVPDQPQVIDAFGGMSFDGECSLQNASDIVIAMLWRSEKPDIYSAVRMIADRLVQVSRKPEYLQEVRILIIDEQGQVLSTAHSGMPFDQFAQVIDNYWNTITMPAGINFDYVKAVMFNSSIASNTDKLLFWRNLPSDSTDELYHIYSYLTNDLRYKVCPSD